MAIISALIFRFFLSCLCFSYKECKDKKNLFCKSCLERQITKGGTQGGGFGQAGGGGNAVCRVAKNISLCGNLDSLDNISPVIHGPAAAL